MIAQPSDSIPNTPVILQVVKTMQTLPPDRQQQVLEFVESLAGTQPEPTPKTIWEKIDELMAQVPDKEWENVPTDGSYQHDHYLYGTPKREL